MPAAPRGTGQRSPPAVGHGSGVACPVPGPRAPGRPPQGRHRLEGPLPVRAAARAWARCASRHTACGRYGLAPSPYPAAWWLPAAPRLPSRKPATIAAASHPATSLASPAHPWACPWEGWAGPGVACVADGWARVAGLRAAATLAAAAPVPRGGRPPLVRWLQRPGRASTQGCGARGLRTGGAVAWLAYQQAWRGRHACWLRVARAAAVPRGSC